MRRLFLLFFLCPFSVLRCFADSYEYTDKCRRAYASYMALHPAEGSTFIRQEITADPDNLMPVFIADYEDCLLLLFNGDKTDYEQRKGHLDARLSVLERGDTKSPWHRLCKAGLYLHWALVNVRMGDNYKAALHFRKSFVLLRDNRRLFPNFDYNDIYWGLEVAALGAIPENYKWITSIFGMNGNVKQGIAYIDKFIDNHRKTDLLYEEAVVISCYLKFYLLYKQQEVWNFINSSSFPVQDNLLNMFVKSNIAVNYRKADVCLETLKKGREDAEFSNYPILEYEQASAMLLKLNLGCITHFRTFLSRYKGGLFVKETWQKIAYAYYIQGNMQDARNARQKIKSVGSTMVDADKQAQRFAGGDTWPDKILLEAHLLTDGGYYKTALERLNMKTETDFSNITDKLEYNFRLGRVYDELGNDNKALQYYQQTIHLGKNRPEHFAARAALQMGFIYEKAGKKQEALARYKECLAMRDHDFQSSIDHLAKAAINRMQL